MKALVYDCVVTLVFRDAPNPILANDAMWLTVHPPLTCETCAEWYRACRNSCLEGDGCVGRNDSRAKRWAEGVLDGYLQ